jgi:hypothetical protein
MDFDPRTDRVPFNDPDEAEQARADATVPSHDARIRHLQRVPLFSGFNEDELRRVAELSRIAEARRERSSRRLESPAMHSSSSSMARWRCERRSERAASYSPATSLANEPTRRGNPDQRRSWPRPMSGCSSSIVPTSGDCWTRPRTSVRRILTILSRRVRRLEQTVQAILRGANPT